MVPPFSKLAPELQNVLCALSFLIRVVSWLILLIIYIVVSAVMTALAAMTLWNCLKPLLTLLNL